MSDTSSDRCIDGDDSTNINRDDFYIPSFRDYRDFYRAGLHRERVDILPNPNAFTVENTTTGYFPFELQVKVIKCLDIGDGTMENPGYITPFAWVSRAWCQEIRKRVLRRCNIKRREHIHWFMEMISPSWRDVFPEEVLFGANITVLNLSFVPLNVMYYQINLRREFCSDDAWRDSFRPDPPRYAYVWPNFWEELGHALARMPKLITFGFCYGSKSSRSDGFHRLSDMANLFPPTLRNLVLRPYDNRYKLTEPVVAPWLTYTFRLDLARWTTATLIYIESPGYIIYPPTRAELNLFANNMSSCFIHNLDRLIIQCGYGLEVDGRHTQTLTGTPWEDQEEGEGDHDFYLPQPPNMVYEDGGIYEIRRNGVGSMVGHAGMIPQEIGWVNDDELPAFGF